MVALTIRVHEELKRQLDAAAESDGQSLNREIGWLLEAALAMRAERRIVPARYVLTSDDAP